MFLKRRLATVFCLAIALAALSFAPLFLNRMGLDLVALLTQVGSPALGAVCCFVAARCSSGSDRAAFFKFGIATLIYVAGNLCYVSYAVTGVSPVFPSLAEAAYFATAAVFVAGIFDYGRVRAHLGRVQIYDFILIYCAVTLASLFLLNGSISISRMSDLAMVVSIAYPAIWFSVAGSGLIALVAYDQGPKSVPFALLLLSVLAEASSDYIYALNRLDDSFQTGGGITQTLWVLSSLLLIWAAVEQVEVTRATPGGIEAQRRMIGRGMAQAAIPAVAIGIIVLSASASGALGNGHFVALSALLAVAFALSVGVREYWVIHTRRVLAGTAEVARADLDRTQQRLIEVLESTTDSVLVLDNDWRVVFFNQRAMHSIALPELVIGVLFWELFPHADSPGQDNYYRSAKASGEAVEFEIFVTDKQIWLGIHAYPTKDGMSLFFRDVSERRRSRLELAHMAHYDALTGLGNRRLFHERLAEALASGRAPAVVLLDLDDFKDVNDALGHQAGDALLVETASRLLATTRADDVVARLGGDEFGIIVGDGTGAMELAARLLVSIGGPHRVDGQPVRFAVSAGIAMGAVGDDAGQMLTKADIALSSTKAEARGAFRMFEPKMANDLQERQAMRADLRLALERGEFRLEYQPLVDLQSDQVCGFEALLRWEHPSLGAISPDVFIPVAEETGLIVGIGAWVLGAAMREATNWDESVSVSINLSSKQFGQGDLVAEVEAALRDSGLAAKRLELEITESVLMRDGAATLLTLKRFRKLGIRIALDDFGTGFSSLAYLQRFPFSKIKIDQSFISGLPGNDESKAIVRSVIGLGQSLGMRVTAEGVKTRAQLDWVRHGCDEAQGYLLSRPVAPAAVPALIRKLNASTARRPREALPTTH